MKRKTVLFIAVGLVLTLLALAYVGAGASGAASTDGVTVPLLINCQGTLTDPATGEVVPDDDYSITFSLYDVPSGGTALWSETRMVTVQGGLFNVLLGSVSPLSLDDFTGTTYLGVKVGADLEMTPRQRVVSVAYALHAQEAVNADTVDGKHASAITASAHDHWAELKKLTAGDGAAGDEFGYSLNISGNTLVVGAYVDDDKGTDSGSAYIFARNQGGADNWGLVKKLTASDGAGGDGFGWSVAIDGDTAVIGAHADDSWRGSAYVLSRNHGGADNWGEVKKLTASDGATWDHFGCSVGIYGDTVVVGADSDDVGANANQGSAYVFARNEGGADNWGEVKKLTASDGAPEDYFTSALAISGDTLVVGASGDDSIQGAAYVFERNEGGTDNWGEVKKLTADDGTASDLFGCSVALGSDTLVVGAIHDAVGGDTDRGSAYVFERNQGGADNWGQVKKLTASDGAAGDKFGLVGISGDTIGVGAIGDDSSRGSAYVFERSQGGAGNWGQFSRLTASDGAADDGFGGNVGISGGTIVVGAPGDDSSRGSAYVFERSQSGHWGETWSGGSASGAGLTIINSGTGDGLQGSSYAGYGVTGDSGATYGGYFTGLNGGAYGEAQRTTTGPTYGVYGKAYSTGNIGVYGENAAPGGGLGNGTGVLGESGGGTAVQGISTGGVGVDGGSYANYGVSGSSGSTYGGHFTGLDGGVYGEAQQTTSGPTHGVYGKAYSTDNIGVYGENAAPGGGLGNGTGVLGESGGGTAVQGISTGGVGVDGGSYANYGVSGSSGSTYGGHFTGPSGVYGSSDTNAGYGGYFTSTRTIGSGGVGVFGGSVNPLGIGVLGENNASMYSAIGVKGTSADGTGVSGVGGYTGVYGEGPTGVQGQASGGGIGVDGRSDSGSGVYGQSDDGTGVHGRSTTTGYGGFGVFGETQSGGDGAGVKGVSTSASPGVWGHNDTHDGVYGSSDTGPGVVGHSRTRYGVSGDSTLGYGGYFSSSAGHALVTEKPSLIAGPNPKQIALLRWYEANEVGHTVGVGVHPTEMAFDGANIWVTNNSGNTVTKLQAHDGKVLGTYPVGSGPFGIAFDGANIWVTNNGDNTITKLRASDGNPVAGSPYPVGVAPRGIAFDGVNIWVANFGGTTVTKLQASDGQLVDHYTVGDHPDHIAFDGENVWITVRDDDVVVKMRASDGYIEGTYPVGTDPEDICFDGANIWVANLSSHDITMLRASDGTVLDTYDIGGVVEDVIFDGFDIWAINKDDLVLRLEIRTGYIMGSYSVGDAPSGLVFDGANIWVANYNDNNVQKL